MVPPLSSRFASAFLIAIACILLAGCVGFDQTAHMDPANRLIGTWRVDLRLTPDAEPYYQQFIISAVTGSSFAGRFYNTEISQARINTDWGKLRIAFVTADGSGDYYHSAVLEGGRLEGLTNSTGRDFLAYWTAVRD